eukprot:250134-Ditylum_brightwellii.AAC.1
MLSKHEVSEATEEKDEPGEDDEAAGLVKDRELDAVASAHSSQAMYWGRNGGCQTKSAFGLTWNSKRCSRKGCSEGDFCTGAVEDNIL